MVFGTQITIVTGAFVNQKTSLGGLTLQSWQVYGTDEDLPSQSDQVLLDWSLFPGFAQVVPQHHLIHHGFVPYAPLKNTMD